MPCQWTCAIGTVIPANLPALAGFWLGQGYWHIAASIDPASTGVVVLIAANYIHHVVTFRAAPVHPQSLTP